LKELREGRRILPGIVHGLFGFIMGLFFMWASYRGPNKAPRFSARHVIVYGFNCWIGPDIGTIMWQISRLVGMSEEGQTVLKYIVHDPYLFTFVFAWWLTFIWLQLTRLDVVKIDGKSKVVKLKKSTLKYWQCFLLIVAGGFSHFFYDFIFENDGVGPVFRWIIDSGYWIDPYIDSGIIFVVVLVALFIIAFLSINNAANKATYGRKIQESAILIMVFSVIYTIYLGIRLSMGLAPIGQECDYGVLIFTSIFLFMPFVLCLKTMDPLERIEE
jgi:hypothetical protein